jgi:hypothetical protein
MLNRANFERWIVTREALRQTFRWAARASFVVLPVIAVGGFAVAHDYQLMAPFVAHPLAYFRLGVFGWRSRTLFRLSCLVSEMVLGRILRGFWDGWYLLWLEGTCR